MPVLRNTGGYITPFDKIFTVLTDGGTQESCPKRDRTWLPICYEPSQRIWITYTNCSRISALMLTVLANLCHEGNDDQH